MKSHLELSEAATFSYEVLDVDEAVVFELSMHGISGNSLEAVGRPSASEFNKRFLVVIPSPSLVHHKVTCRLEQVLPN